MNLIKYFSVLFVILLIGGCATPAEMRTQMPVFEVQSLLPSKVVAICITDKWENSGFLGLTVPVHMRQTTTGYMVSIRDAFNTTSLLVDIEDFGTGSKTLFYRNLSFGGADFIDSTKSCQK